MAASGEENCIRQLVSSEDELVQAIVRDTTHLCHLLLSPDCDFSWSLLLLIEPGLFNNVYGRSEKGEDQ